MKKSLKIWIGYILITIFDIGGLVLYFLYPENLFIKIWALFGLALVTYVFLTVTYERAKEWYEKH
jgi:hypothetical protein